MDRLPFLFPCWHSFRRGFIVSQGEGVRVGFEELHVRYMF